MKQLKFCAFVAVVFLSTCQIASAQDDKAAKKAAALKRKMKLESCCLLISAANTNSKDFEKTVNEHPEKNKKVIMQKWQANRAQMCLNSISETQMDALQGYKTNSEEFPLWNSAEYQSLINYDIASMKVPVQLTQAELDMVYETEELIDKLRAEGSAKVQKEMGSTTIAFFDFANMGTFQGLVYIIAIGAILGYVVSILLKAVQPEPDLAKQRREKIESRKKK